MSTVTTPANPKVGFVSLGCPNDTQSKLFHGELLRTQKPAKAGFLLT